MPTEELDKEFLEMEGFFELTSQFFTRISGGQVGKSFWSYDEAMKRELERNPSLKENLLKMTYKDGFRNYFSYQELRCVLEESCRERFSATEHPKWVALLKGDELTVPNNIIHIMTNTSFLELSEENLGKAARALLETWVYLPPFFHSAQAESDFEKIVDYSVDLNSASINYLQQPKNEKYSFCIVFSTKVKLAYNLERAWDPEVYRTPRPFGQYDRFKLIWDLLNYRDKFRIERRDFDYYPCLKAFAWDEYVDWINFSVAKGEGKDFLGTMRLLSEFLTHGQSDEEIEKLEKFQKGKFLYGIKSNTLFSKGIGKIGANAIGSELSNVQDLLDGLKASQELMKKYEASMAQSGRPRTRLEEGIGLIIAKGIALDPVSYVDDERPYVAELAKAIVSGAATEGRGSGRP